MLCRCFAGRAFLRYEEDKRREATFEALGFLAGSENDPAATRGALGLDGLVSLSGCPWRALVCRVGERDRSPELLNHLIALVTADCPFRFRGHVPRHDGEVARVAPHTFVLAQRELNVLRAAALAALANELEQFIPVCNSEQTMLKPLVDIAEPRFVLGNSRRAWGTHRPIDTSQLFDAVGLDREQRDVVARLTCLKLNRTAQDISDDLLGGVTGAGNERVSELVLTELGLTAPHLGHPIGVHQQQLARCEADDRLPIPRVGKRTH